MMKSRKQMLRRGSVSLATIITIIVKDAISLEYADKEKEGFYSVLRYTLGGLVKRRTEGANGCLILIALSDLEIP
jgi:hypothetical protein